MNRKIICVVIVSMFLLTGLSAVSALDTKKEVIDVTEDDECDVEIKLDYIINPNNEWWYPDNIDTSLKGFRNRVTIRASVIDCPECQDWRLTHNYNKPFKLKLNVHYDIRTSLDDTKIALRGLHGNVFIWRDYDADYLTSFYSDADEWYHNEPIVSFITPTSTSAGLYKDETYYYEYNFPEELKCDDWLGVKMDLNWGVYADSFGYYSLGNDEWNTIEAHDNWEGTTPCLSISNEIQITFRKPLIKDKPNNILEEFPLLEKIITSRPLVNNPLFFRIQEILQQFNLL